MPITNQMTRSPLLSDQRGFTLIEVMLASLVLIVGVMATVDMVDNGNRQTAVNLGREGANNLSREVIERGRELPYRTFTKPTATTQLQALPGLAHAGGSGWRIRRRNVDYSVTAEVCELDDRSDGVGARDPATFCAVSPPGGGGGGGGGPAGIWADLGITDTSLHAQLNGSAFDVACLLTGPLNVDLPPTPDAIRAGTDVVRCPTGELTTVDQNADDFKRVTVEVVRIVEPGTTPVPRPVRQVSVIPNPEGARQP